MAGGATKIGNGIAQIPTVRAHAHGREISPSHPYRKQYHNYYYGVISAVAGCAPDEMGVGPAVAIPKLLEQVGLTVPDVGVWEINEAFASQALYSVRKLGIDEAKVNPNGGAIAIGHPLGATGARQLADLLPGLGRSGQDVGVVSMCIGTGMGMAGMFVRE